MGSVVGLVGDEGVGDPNRPLLTIMIPVYNGEIYLGYLLKLFERFFQKASPQLLSLIEMRVINNVSSDRSLEVAESFAKTIKNLYVHNETVHVKSAEENVFRSFGHCLGEYTWVLGVDDVPVFENIERMLRILAEKRADFLISNTLTINKKEEVLSSNVFEMDVEVVEKPIVDVARELGIWYVLAAMSSQILRTRWVRDYDLFDLIKKTSAIYSHVVAYLEVFKGGVTQVVNFPMVFYNVNYNASHWRRAAARIGVFDEFFWTLGFMRQIKYLEDKGAIDRDFFFYCLDRNEAIIFRPILVILGKIIEQLRIMPGGIKLFKTAKRNSIDMMEFREMIEFLQERDPFCRGLVWSIVGLYEKIMKGEEPVSSDWDEVMELYESFSKNFILAPFFIEKFDSFEVYKVYKDFYAIHTVHKKLLLEILRSVEKRSLPPFFFVSRDIQDLHRQIQKRNQSENFDHFTEFTTKKALEMGRGEVLKDLQALMLRERAKDEATCEKMRDRCQAIMQSNSWRITGPIRVVGRLVYGVISKLKQLLKRFVVR